MEEKGLGDQSQDLGSCSLSEALQSSVPTEPGHHATMPPCHQATKPAVTPPFSPHLILYPWQLLDSLLLPYLDPCFMWSGGSSEPRQ